MCFVRVSGKGHPEWSSCRLGGFLDTGVDLCIYILYLEFACGKCGGDTI